MFVGLVISLIVASIGVVIGMAVERNNVSEIALFAEEHFDNVIINGSMKRVSMGFYSSDGFYCVRTGDRTLKNIERTEVHEQCHALVYDDYGHFCHGRLQQPN